MRSAVTIFVLFLMTRTCNTGVIALREVEAQKQVARVVCTPRTRSGAEAALVYVLCVCFITCFGMCCVRAWVSQALTSAEPVNCVPCGDTAGKSKATCLCRVLFVIPQNCS